LVDVGWGGTMQEVIYKVLNEKYAVTGFYMGLRETYNILERTKRYGLVFSVHPYTVYSDHILMANTQIYEQLLSANQGSVLGYDKTVENFTIEYHHPLERDLFEKHLRFHQDFMMEQFKVLLEDLSLICYNYAIVQRKITGLALRNGLLINSDKMKFMTVLNKGFIQNIGDNKVGIQYSIDQGENLFLFIKDFLIRPESKFRHLAKLKWILFEKNTWYRHLVPMRLIFSYLRINRFFREKILKESVVKGYNYF
ncbi:MAG: hypothetical protein KJO25_07130, partial [Bacteroidia bacterium]|nr:hypothetical protein [Bacteroidia bacterium]